MSDSDPENPLVFPQDTERLGRNAFGAEVATFRRHGGMTLRDSFAQAALSTFALRDISEDHPPLIAEYVYKIADAMLVARQQKEPAK